MTGRRGGGRAGFTLVELIVVIGIIAILVGLLSSAVMRLLVKGPQMACRADINGLSQAIAAFKADYGDVKVLPSKLVLHETLANYQRAGVTQAETDTFRFLQQWLGRRMAAQIDWDNDLTLPGGKIETDPAKPHILNGEQALVFLLGGAQVTSGAPGTLGFSTTPGNPMAAGGTRKGPYFEFKSNRLVVPTTSNFSQKFFVYLDPFNKKSPYVYLADYSTNEYKSESSLGVTAYAAGGGRFFQTGGFQIISAGADGVFGNPALYDPLRGTTDLNGRDDMANFSARMLSGPQE